MEGFNPDQIAVRSAHFIEGSYVEGGDGMVCCGDRFRPHLVRKADRCCHVDAARFCAQQIMLCVTPNTADSVLGARENETFRQSVHAVISLRRRRSEERKSQM